MTQCGGSCLGRRAFVSRATLAAVAAALGNGCGDGVIGGFGPSERGLTGDVAVKLGDYPELATPGKVVRVEAGSIPIAVTRTGPANFEAYSLQCPHAGTTVNIVPSGFDCPNHRARFDSHGAWTGGQSTSNLAALSVSYDPTAAVLTISGGPAPNVDLTVKLASYPSLNRVGGLARVDAPAGVPVGIARTEATTFLAYGLACTHELRVIEPTGGYWECPKHHARFAADGSVLRGPATAQLSALTVVHDGSAGTLRITGWAPQGNLDDD